MDTREKILQGARNYLIKNGQKGFSVRSVAREAGVNHGLVHHYFGSMDQMIVDLLDEESGKVIKKVSSSALANDLNLFKETMIKELISNPDVSKLILEICSYGQNIPEICDKICSIMEERRQMISRVLGIKNPLDIVLIQSIILGILLQKKMDPSIDVTKYLGRAFELLNINIITN